VSERTGTSKPEPELRAAAETRIHHLLAAHFHYPLLARRKGWQGRVQLGLRLQADGRLTQVRVVRSSGHGILDRSARQAAEAIGRLPDTRLPVDHYDLVVPVHYRLLDERARREGGDYHG
jgi:protein TonB